MREVLQNRHVTLGCFWLLIAVLFVPPALALAQKAGLIVPSSGAWLDQAKASTGLEVNRAGVDFGDDGKSAMFYVEIKYVFANDKGCEDISRIKLAVEPFCVAFAADRPALLAEHAGTYQRSFALRFRDSRNDTAVVTVPGRICLLKLEDIAVSEEFFKKNARLPKGAH